MFDFKQSPFSLSPLGMLIECSLSAMHDNAQIKSLIALSYTWRTDLWHPVAPAYQCISPNQPVPICAPPWHFLLDLRETSEESIGIDQM